jgi:transposase InsO family protein
MRIPSGLTHPERGVPSVERVDLSFRAGQSTRTWIDHYNEHYLHSSLGYKMPRQFARDYQHSQRTPFWAA